MERRKSGNDFSEPKERSKQSSLYSWIGLTGILGTLLVFLAIFYIWLYLQQIQNGYRLAKLYEQQEQLLAIERKLKLEWSRFQDPFQMEELGRRQFGLAPPRQDQRVVMR